VTRVRTRFAPSPTGSLHLGNARTAALNWAVARHHGGDFILRIEDTDAERNVPGAERELLADLAWLGLIWDEGPDPATGKDRGEYGPYHQSERVALYRRRARELVESGAAYRCFCTPEELESERSARSARGGSPRYSGRCRALDPHEARERADRGVAHVIRLATPESGEVVVHDEVRGRVTFDAAEIGDFVVVRSDGVPTYNFAVVVDDAAMEITHVIRGAGHLSNTPHQLLVYRALGVEPPAFAHTPDVLGPDRTKLSKRTGAKPLRQLREEGLHPDAVFNYLSLLGWSSPSGDEVLSRDRIVAEVSLDRVNAGDVVLDPDKLHWLSARHIERMSVAALSAAVRPFVERSRFAALRGARFRTALEAVRSHLGAFGEITDHLDPFLGCDAPPALSAEDARVAAEVRTALEAVEPWEAGAIQQALAAAGRSVGVRGRNLYVPVRAATTCAEHGPPLPAVLEVQGRGAVLERLDRAVRDAIDPV
jgi:nondiscriminating glutamyl-tRNA synthetase